MPYFALIGDIVQSRQIRDRGQLQQNFRRSLEQIRQQFPDQFISRPTVTIGDEFQAVLRNGDHLFAMLQQLEDALPGVGFRYGLGLGQIDTEINPDAAIGMDGPAFHFARSAVEEARKQDRRFVLQCSDHFFRKRLNILLRWLDSSTRGWSPEKRRIFRLVKQNLTQKEIAGQIGISQPAVSQHINNSFFKLALDTEQLIQEEINRYLEGRE